MPDTGEKGLLQRSWESDVFCFAVFAVVALGLGVAGLCTSKLRLYSAGGPTGAHFDVPTWVGTGMFLLTFATVVLLSLVPGRVVNLITALVGGIGAALSFAPLMEGQSGRIWHQIFVVAVGVAGLAAVGLFEAFVARHQAASTTVRRDPRRTQG